MTVENRKNAFVKLGDFLTQFIAENTPVEALTPNEIDFHNRLSEAISNSIHHNGWFTRENILFALNQWSEALTEASISEWVGAYQFKNGPLKTVAIIMAGNIPLVGFHDFLSVLMSGNKALIKLSSNDKLLLPILVDYLVTIDPNFKTLVEFTEEKLTDFDAVIATGSNNTARYFEYYFSKKPNIIRKNRNSVAILTGNESKTQLEALAEDVFRYYGLGCRNVSKLFVPENYDFKVFFEAMYVWNPIIHHHKYANNYDYNKAVYLMSEFQLLENGFLILKEDNSYSSPISVLFYETYKSEEKLRSKLTEDAEKIQCIVSGKKTHNHISFGKTQQPSLTDYADQIDTMKFLLNL